MLGVSPSDSEVWERARSERWVVVSKDADFLHRALVSAPPPWVVHVRLGNVRLRVFQELLAGLWPRVEAEFPEAKVVSVFHDRLEVIR